MNKMHLGEIVGLDFFLEWLLRSKTSFYGIELNLPWWFGLSSWNYLIVSFVLILVNSKWTENSRFPYRLFAFHLALQAPLSFCADYLYMSEDSIFQVLDRTSAVIASMMEILRQISHFQSGHISNLFAVLIALATMSAIICYYQSYISQMSMNRDGFIFWHFLWHLFPLVISFFLLIENFYCNQWIFSKMIICRRQIKKVN
mmetsp:Transcript_25723/g.29390  ORF Transcript_25723/g.29390 Transcript_25723/m.29390 type:complete len:201 (-) Transcript_25723:104-706(-)